MEFAAGVLSVWDPRPSHGPLLHTVYMYTVPLIHTGKGGGGGELTREKFRWAFRKYQYAWLYLQSINSIKH
jgi:hypothetical protein